MEAGTRAEEVAQFIVCATKTHYEATRAREYGRTRGAVAAVVGM
jgi:hypothetical protein